MSKILKNQTGSPIAISDTGVSLPASPATYTIPATDYLLWAASSNIITQIGNGNVIVSDGASDLSIADGTNLIQGNFPSTIKITDGADTLDITAAGKLNIDSITGTVVLPTGASSSANQIIQNSSLSSIDTKLTDKSQFTKITDGTDTALVTTSGRLQVDAVLTTSSTLSSWTSKLRYTDMNASNGGVARGTNITTTWTDVFSYSGSGYLSGFILNLDTFTTWKIRFLVDGEEIFSDSNGIISDDITGDTLYDLDDVTDVNQAGLGLSKGAHDRVVFVAPMQLPIRYNTSVVIKLARVSGGAKKFQAGLVILSKET